ncbi:MAG: hypothetical protein AB1497_12270 [Bacillota bacterium]
MLSRLLRLWMMALILPAQAIIFPSASWANGLPAALSGDFSGRLFSAVDTQVGIDAESLSIHFIAPNAGGPA